MISTLARFSSSRWVALPLFVAVVLFVLAIAASFMQFRSVRLARAFLAGREFQLEIADTPPLRAQGLSGRASIPANGGMLFLFPRPDRYTFWMKDLRFPIDIFWLRGATIVFVKENAPPPASGTPDGALERFRPHELADRVIEVPAGTARELDVRAGQEVKLLLR